MENIIRKNFCDFCKNKNKENCMEIEKQKHNDVISYRCVNFEKEENALFPRYYKEFNYEIKSNRRRI